MESIENFKNHKIDDMHSVVGGRSISKSYSCPKGTLSGTKFTVGAGVTSVLFFVTLKKIKTIDEMVAKKGPTPPEEETASGKEESAHE